MLITALWLSRAAATAAWHHSAAAEPSTLAAAGALAGSDSVAESRRHTNAPNPRIDLDGKLEIRGIRFEPLVAGRNIVHFEVQNQRHRRGTLGLDIRTTSPRPSGRASAWQTQYFLDLAPDATVPARYAFKISQPLAADSTIRLQFYALDAPEQFKLEQYAHRVFYQAADLPRRPPDQAPPPPAPDSQAALARSLLIQIQAHLRANEYSEVVRGFTKDYCDLEIMGRGRSRSDADQLKRLFDGDGFRHFWDRDEFLELQPGDVLGEAGALQLHATRADQTWTLGLVQDAGQWKIDSVSGFKAPSLGWANWTERLLPAMQQRRTEHFDVYYFTNSTAQRRIDAISRQREEGLAAICRFLQSEPAGRIRLVLFEEARTKHKETGHQGSGWATGQMIVEVCNEQTQMNPYHEAVHLIAGQVGSPPALFNEGLAVYLSEHLRAPGPEEPGRGKVPVDERAAQLLIQGEWIALPELLTYPEIGPERSRPEVSYPLAGSFVKFLVERQGREKFLEAYGVLRKPKDLAMHTSNTQTLERIYGRPLPQLEDEWKQALRQRSSSSPHRNP